MKRILLWLLVTSASFCLCAQAPQGFLYHAVVRNDTGSVMINQPVTFRFRILKDSVNGKLVYEEKQFDTTNTAGTVNLVIGNGTDTVGSFAKIDWGKGMYFLNIGLDIHGGCVFAEMGTMQFLSVPYALYANKAGNGFSGNYNDLTNKPVTDGSETKITVGNNMTISGTGTIQRPYILNTKVHYIGERYGGGIVFFVYDNGQHGLIAALKDQDPSVAWYNGNKRYTNTTGDGVGSGDMNTAIIITLQTNDNPLGNFAAKICADYSVTIDGVTYGDWYLPSKHELELLFYQNDLVGNFQSDYYWSSTEFSSVSAWCQNFKTGWQFNLNKNMPYGVRAVRRF